MCGGNGRIIAGILIHIHTHIDNWTEFVLWFMFEHGYGYDYINEKWCV